MKSSTYEILTLAFSDIIVYSSTMEEDTNYTCSGSSSLKSDMSVEHSSTRKSNRRKSLKYKPSTIKRKFGERKRKRIFQRKEIPVNSIPTEQAATENTLYSTEKYV